MPRQVLTRAAVEIFLLGVWAAIGTVLHAPGVEAAPFAYYDTVMHDRLVTKQVTTVNQTVGEIFDATRGVVPTEQGATDVLGIEIAMGCDSLVVGVGVTNPHSGRLDVLGTLTPPACQDVGGSPYAYYEVMVLSRAVGDVIATLVDRPGFDVPYLIAAGTRPDGSWTMYIAWTDAVSLQGRGFSYDGQGHNFVRVIVGADAHSDRLEVQGIEVLVP